MGGNRAIRPLTNGLLICLAILPLAPIGTARSQSTLAGRDYMTWQRELSQGTRPRVGDVRSLAPLDHIRDQVTWVMSRDRALLVQIEPVEQPATVYMLVSTAASPHRLRAIWGSDNLTEPIRFWTDRFWSPVGKCNPTGCPKIRFRATRGKVRVTILQKRSSTTQADR